MKIVLDTNVFVAGIFWSGPPNKILEAWEAGRFQVVISQAIVCEYVRITYGMAEKFPTVAFEPYLEFVTLHSESCDPVILEHQISRDPDDDKFIACALAANVRIVVSGDKDLLCLGEYEGIKFLSPADFVKHHLTQ